MKIVMFCETNIDRGQSSGVSVTSVRLVAIPGAQGPNSGIFVNGVGNGFFELQNITASGKAELPASGKFQMEITPYVEPAPSPSA